jgi:hypothetical protein
MTGSGIFPKVDGDILYAYDVNNIIYSAAGILFKNLSNYIYNGSLIGFNSAITPQYYNINFDTLSDNAKINSGLSSVNNIPIFSSVVYDNFSDGSVNLTKWRSGVGDAIAETIGSLLVYSAGAGNAYVIASGTNQIDCRQECSLFIKRRQKSYNNVNTVTWLKLTDEHTNEVQFTRNDGSTNETLVRIDIFPTGSYLNCYVDDLHKLAGSDVVPTGSLNHADKWFFKYQVDTGGAEWCSGAITMFNYIIHSSPTTATFISNDYAPGSIITNAMCVSTCSFGSGTSVNYYLSANSGINYQTATPNNLVWFTNPGSQLRLKTELISYSGNVYQLKHYALMYNVI